MAGRSSPPPSSNPDHNHHKRQVVARDCHPRTQKKESSALTHAMLCYVGGGGGGGRPAADRWIVGPRSGLEAYRAADWQIPRHQPDGAISFDPLLPRVLSCTYCKILYDRSSSARRGGLPAAQVAFHRGTA